LKTERLEDLRAINVQIQEEKERIHRFDKRIADLEEDLEATRKLLILLKELLTEH
jgi:hypothetical protein